MDDAIAGYGSIAVAGPWQDKPTIYEFYVLPQYRDRLFALFAALVDAAGTTAIETQTNDVILATILHSLGAERHVRVDSVSRPGHHFPRRSWGGRPPRNHCRLRRDCGVSTR